MWGPPLVLWAASRDRTRSVRSRLVTTSARAGFLLSRCSSSSCTFWLPTEYCSRQAQLESACSAAVLMLLGQSGARTWTSWSMLSGQPGACLSSLKHAAWTVWSMLDSLELLWSMQGINVKGAASDIVRSFFRCCGMMSVSQTSRQRWLTVILLDSYRQLFGSRLSHTAPHRCDLCIQAVLLAIQQPGPHSCTQLIQPAACRL